MTNHRLAAPAALLLSGLALPALAQGNGHHPGTGASGENVLKFDQRTFSVRESAGEAVLSVERFKGSSGEISAHYETVPGTATEGVDYEPVSGTLTWGDGDTARKTFTVPILDDDEFEVRETIELVLTDLTGGATLHPGQGHATLMILDVPEDNPGHQKNLDELPGEIRFRRDEFQAVEGGDPATIVAERVGGRAGAASVHYSTADGSATAGDDYEAASGMLSWGDGEMGPRSFPVATLQDDLEEGNEDVLLELSDPVGASLDPEGSEADLLILDDDGATTACVPDDETLCLAGGRFMVRVDWRSPQGDSGAGQVDQVSDNTGLVWFFQPENKEVLIKVLDACEPFDTYWVFFAATTNVDFTVQVTDTATGLVKEYTNTAGEAAEPVQDTFSFKTCQG